MALHTNAQTDTSGAQRQAHPLTLAIESRAVYTYSIPPGPFITQNDTLQLYPGDTAFVEIQKKGDSITSLKAVKQNNHPEKTLTISFQQVVEKGFHQNMALKIDNPFNKNLQCNMQAAIIMQKKWQSMDMINAPVGTSYITWPQIILGVKLYAWSFEK